MSGRHTSEQPEALIVRTFDAPRDLVFQSWIDPDGLKEWFATNEFVVTSSVVDVRVGGKWRIEFRSGRGRTYSEYGEYREVSPPERLVFTLTQEEAGERGPETLVTVVLAERDGKTQMTFHQTGFDSTKRRDANVEGWAECFEKLTAYLQLRYRKISGSDSDRVQGRHMDQEREIRSLFDEWFRVASAKDIEGAMKPIARDVVSYEHEAPLQYVGLENVREVCQRGFDAVQGDFHWDIPDLKVIVSGDLVVTWGLNRMRSQPTGQAPIEAWSRGTRIFKRVDGEWKMIHQHVSFPYDPQTGQAAMEQKP